MAFFHGQASQFLTNGTFTNPVKFELTAQEGPSAVIERVLTPISIQEIPTGHFVYDLGQNMVGTVRLHLKGERGLSIKLRYGEMSYANGENLHQKYPLRCQY